MLDQQQLPVGAQHPADLAERRLRILDGAQNERRDDRVERCVAHREILRGSGDHGRSTVRTPHQPLTHRGVRLGEDQLRKARWIVRHVQARSRADLEHTAACLTEQRTADAASSRRAPPTTETGRRAGRNTSPTRSAVRATALRCMPHSPCTKPRCGTRAAHRPPRPSRWDGRFSLRSEQTQAGGLCDRRRARRAAELSPHVGHVPMNGVPADHELLCDLWIGEATRDEREHLDARAPKAGRARKPRRRSSRALPARRGRLAPPRRDPRTRADARGRPAERTSRLATLPRADVQARTERRGRSACARPWPAPRCAERRRRRRRRRRTPAAAPRSPRLRTPSADARNAPGRPALRPRGRSAPAAVSRGPSASAPPKEPPRARLPTRRRHRGRRRRTERAARRVPDDGPRRRSPCTRLTSRPRASPDRRRADRGAPAGNRARRRA